MRYFSSIVVLLLFSTFAGRTQTPGIQVPVNGTYEFVKKAKAYPYLLFLPQNYSAHNAEGYPMIVFLHGSGERGNDINLVKKNGTPCLVESWPDFPFVLVTPQCPQNEIWDNERVMATIDEVMHSLNIDTNRIYGTGLSMGGYGIFAVAAAYPWRFAAIAPVCGGGFRLSAIYLKNLPVWAFHGEEDPIVPPEESKGMVEAINFLGGDAKLTLYPGVGHNAWEPAYSDPELYQWFLKHTKKSSFK